MIPIINKPKLKSSDLFELPVLAAIPWLPQVVYASSYPPNFHNTQYTPEAFAYKQLVANLREISQSEQLTQSLLLTATCEEKSSSWIVMNLVYFLCKAQQSVLLIDSDFNSPSVHLAFDIEYDRGLLLSEFVQEVSSNQGFEHQVAETIQQYAVTFPDIPGLAILNNAKARAADFKSLDLLSLQLILRQLKNYFDWIIIDSAPILENSETIALAQHVDGLLLIKDHKFHLQHRKAVLRLIKENNLPLVGVIERADL